jgi:hypothetical protein
MLHAQMVKTVWDYPVKPGSEEWRNTSYAEKVKKSQPPKELLDSWNTETLFKCCTNYPFNKVTLMFNNPNDGFKRVYEQSIVWQEFIQRKDAFAVFSNYFEARPYERILEMKNIETRNDELFTLFFLEKIASETNFAINLNPSDKKKLANVILQSHRNKQDYPKEFTGFHYNSSLTALLKILESAQMISSKDEISLTKFREKTGNEYFTDDAMDAAIIKTTVNYINK